MAYSCKTTLAAANRMPKVTRRHWQANAMRHINAARTRARACQKKIAAVEAELRALAH